MELKTDDILSMSLKGKKQSEEHIKRRIEARRLNGTYSFSQESRNKMSQTRKGKKLSDEHKLNISIGLLKNPPMKGKKHTEEARKKITAAQIGKPRPNQRGEKSRFWKGGITKENKIKRQSVEFRNWRKIVFERDDFTCQACAKRGGDLHPDHVLPLSIYPELAFDVLNGRTLCVPCHKQTDTYGYRSKVFEPEMTYLIINHK